MMEVNYLKGGSNIAGNEFHSCPHQKLKPKPMLLMTLKGQNLYQVRGSVPINGATIILLIKYVNNGNKCSKILIMGLIKM